jgi:hypothetical protein
MRPHFGTKATALNYGMDDEFRVVDDKIDSHVTEIQLFKKDGSPSGVARIWPRGERFQWAHPNGAEGEAESFEKAMAAINVATDRSSASTPPPQSPAA